MLALYALLSGLASACEVNCPRTGESVDAIVCKISCDCQRDSCLCELQRVLLYRIVVSELRLDSYRQSAEYDLVVGYL